MLGEGKIDYIISPRPEIEDHLAGILVVKEAGATARCYDGSAFRLTTFNEHLDNALTINNADLFNKILDIIKE